MGNFETYHRFISHLQIKLSDVQHHNIVFGTDQEAAVIKAITACFPQAKHMLCTRHLKENARENLRKNYTQPIVSEILSKIFDAGGLLNAKGLIVYNELEAELQQTFNASPYLLNKMLPKLKSKVFMPPFEQCQHSNPLDK
jgi:transposase-like protein